MATSYHWCLVPECKSTSISTPDKLFICVPGRPESREKWLKLAGRNFEELSLKSTLYFCEDHFDLENDMENYMAYKMGYAKVIRRKKECLPSKFKCQTDDVQEESKSNIQSPTMKTVKRKMKQKEKSSSAITLTSTQEEPLHHIHCGTQTTLSVTWDNLLTFNNIQHSLKILFDIDLETIEKIEQIAEENEEICKCDRQFMQIKDQILLVIWKYKYNLNFETYQYMFTAPLDQLNNIFESFTNCFNYYLTRYEEELRMVIVTPLLYMDDFYIPVAAHDNPIYDQINYSPEKGTTAFKAIIGYTCDNCIVFVSDIYAGSTKADTILEEMAFEQMISKSVQIVVSQSLKKDKYMSIYSSKHQYCQVYATEDASVCIKMNNFKKLIYNRYRILCDVMPVSQWSIANKIFRNCIMLNNLISTEVT